MEIVNRTLTAEVLAALTYWPGIVYGGQKNPPDPVDIMVLRSFFNEMLQELPWWNRGWEVSHVKPGIPSEIASDYARSATGFTEVSVPGTVSDGCGDGLPFVAQVRFERDRLIRFQAKIGDMVIVPATAPGGRPEPHPFAAVFTRLMDLRGIPTRDMAEQTGRSRVTIDMLRDGCINPDAAFVKEIAETLDMSEADIRAIAGLDE
ncbi:helix-turn-helix domain-containing protein [Actinomadura montaniterrae]|uniref:XRE family transcriptional regulator n=1 Tax=Actinomadura montaniterrae TaxID=1803903 RepID=A0A6L3W716_9ACTN|nr:helix-turn-helix domain-containing protein [Actinomadura montaniterrae]KAB2388778.1 XRE family transcriptional regulator [Actinomadura montaniterrae]